MSGELPSDLAEWPSVQLELRLAELALARSYALNPRGTQIVTWEAATPETVVPIAREITHIVFELACRTVEATADI